MKDIMWCEYKGNFQWLAECAGYDADNLYEIEVPEGITFIESYMFYGFDKLQTIKLPSTLTEIQEEAFCEVPGTIYFNGTQEQWESILLPHALDGFEGTIVFNQ